MASQPEKNVGRNKPPYIIDGLEQSHWLASDAVVSQDGNVTIPDRMGMQVLNPATSAWAMQYISNGWQHNGKVLPVVRRTICGLYYETNIWVNKLSNHDGITTLAALINPRQPTEPPRINDGGSNLGNSGITTQVFYGPSRLPRWAVESWGMQRVVEQLPRVETADEKSSSPQLWFMEHDNKRGTSRIWVNGIEWIIDNGCEGHEKKKVKGATKKFCVSVHGGPSWSTDADFAQLHIWKGSLTKQQRDDVIEYLKGISGIV